MGEKHAHATKYSLMEYEVLREHRERRDELGWAGAGLKTGDVCVEF